jgi:hypothetical protein
MMNRYQKERYKEISNKMYMNTGVKSMERTLIRFIFFPSVSGQRAML